uniref:Cysteine-rich protein n=1 Tax=Spironucleus salmonicida TaxID=348837 RepID=V6LYX2_9EUKA|eukprot:EST48931.1 Cysteine-rich protein [Spironucleus salmonicida]
MCIPCTINRFSFLTLLPLAVYVNGVAYNTKSYIAGMGVLSEYTRIFLPDLVTPFLDQWEGKCCQDKKECCQEKKECTDKNCTDKKCNEEKKCCTEGQCKK